jgi:hypothetical protein
MEISLNAKVECTDGACGHSVYVLINPVLEKVTHLVVREDASNTEYIVPVDVVSESITNIIQLRCSKEELEKMAPFIQTEFVHEQVPAYPEYREEMFGTGSHYYICASACGAFTNSTRGIGCTPWYTRRGDGWLCRQSRRVRSQPGE